MYVKQPYFTGHGDAPPPGKPPTKPSPTPDEPASNPANDVQK